jgi:hypothetical protein
MAINIKELNIKLHVGSGNTSSSTQRQGTDQPSASEEVLVKKTVKEVLRILKEQKER